MGWEDGESRVSVRLTHELARRDLIDAEAAGAIGSGARVADLGVDALAELAERLRQELRRRVIEPPEKPRST